jgi:hypothetical protein
MQVLCECHCCVPLTAGANCTTAIRSSYLIGQDTFKFSGCSTSACAIQKPDLCQEGAPFNATVRTTAKHYSLEGDPSSFTTDKLAVILIFVGYVLMSSYFPRILLLSLLSLGGWILWRDERNRIRRRNARREERAHRRLILVGQYEDAMEPLPLYKKDAEIIGNRVSSLPPAYASPGRPSVLYNEPTE